MDGKKSLVLDETDKGILAELQKNGRESYKNIARKLGVSDGTVRLRTERMIESGFLRITASVDPLYFGTTLTALVGINLEHRANKTIMAQIAALTGVQSVINVTGRYDLLAEVSVPSRNVLRQFLVDELSEVGGVTATETYMIMEAMNKWVDYKDVDI